MKIVRITNHKITIQGQDIHYRTAGNGRPLILIHGLSGSTRWWKKNIGFLAKHYKLHLIDLPGFGGMSRFRGRLALNKVSSWLVELLLELGVKKADFIGHSMGGYICIKIAAQNPQILRRLVLVSSVGISPGKTIINSFLPLLLALRYARPTFLPILATDAMRAGPLTLYQSVREVLCADITKEIRCIKAPTLLVWGEKDSLVPAKCATIFNKKIKNSKLFVLKGAGHVPMYDTPHEFNQAIHAFLESKRT